MLKDTSSKKETVKNLRYLAKINGIPKRHAECVFSNYKTNSENQKHFDACYSWNGKDSITLTGNTGTGKTHLAIAMLKNFPMVELTEKRKIEQKESLERAIENNEKAYTQNGKLMQKEDYQRLLDEGLVWRYRPAVCLFVPLVELFIKINNAAMSDDGKLKMLNDYATNKIYDCICFDDLGAEKMTDAKRENLYFIIDTRYREMLPTIITSNFTINEINDVEPRIASRLAEMGKILQFNGKDYRK